MQTRVMVLQLDVTTIDKEVELMNELIGSFTTGDQFVERCRGIYNSIDTINKIGLAFNRLKKSVKAMKEGGIPATEPALAEATIPVSEIIGNSVVENPHGAATND